MATKKKTSLDKYQRELVDLVKWDTTDESLELTVEVDMTGKMYHIAKRIIIGEEGEQWFCPAGHTKTLFNTLKEQPTGNIFLFIMNKISLGDLAELQNAELTETGLRPYALGGAKAFADAIKDAMTELNSLADTPAEPVEVATSGMGTLTLPESHSLTAIDSLLAGSKLPPLSDIFNELAAVGNDTKRALDKAAEHRDNHIKTVAELKTMKDELRELSLKASRIPVVKVKANGPIPSGTVVYKKASKVFNMELKSDFEVPTWKWVDAKGKEVEHPDVPEVDPHYILREEQLTRVLYALVTNKRAYLQGHTGTGKTTLIQQVAAVLKWPFIRINFDSELSRMDLIGRDTIKDGASKFIDGILPQAMSGPYIACFDEIDFVRPDVAYVMQAALEGNGMVITEDGGRVIEPDPMFRMFATGNTVGQGDEYGMYQGARPQSIAFLDRFTIWLKVDYLTKDERSQLVSRHFPAMLDADQRVLSQYVEEHLTAFMQNDIIQPISPRGMLAIAEATVALGSIKEALSMVVLDRANNDDHITLKGLVDRVCAE